MLMYDCASISPPQGGKKDIIPPNIVDTKPKNYDTNVKKNTVTFYFNERIDIKDLKNHLIINPKIEGEIETNADNNQLVIKFPKTTFLNKNCKTYSIYLGDGIKDANEGNILKANKFIFSNCDRIDTAKIAGFVVDAYSRDTLKNIFIALYTNSDTLNIETQKPDYYGFTDKKGAFFIDFIKPSIYKIIAFDDKNKNMVYESKKEKLGFLQNTIIVNENIEEKIALELSQNDITKPSILSIKDDAEILIKLDNPIKEYKIDVDSTVIYKMADNKKEITIYKNIFDKDSIPIKIYLKDSSYNDTTILVKVLRTDTSKIKHTKNIIVNKNNEEQSLEDSINYTIKFTDPVIATNFNKLYIIIDSTEKVKITEKDIKWNNEKTTLNYYTRPKIKPKKELKFCVENKAFYSVKKDTNSKLEVIFKPKKDKKIEENNFVSFIINTKYKNYFIEVLDDKGKTYFKTFNNNKFRLSNIPNGKYSILAWIDENEDGYWNPGHYKNNTKPEKSYLFKNVLEVKTNWDLEDINIDF